MIRLAVVEDNPDNRLLVRAILGDAYDITEYASGPEALAGLKSTPVDMALLDISLPGMDGIEVLGHLRADPATAQLPVLALTAHAMAGDRERYLAAGFDDYMTKPIVDDAALVRVVERFAGQPR
jgi:CheY-like chemotaxis protein